MSSERLQRWIVRHAARETTRRRSVEDALLSNRFVPYASRRLFGFALTRLWATAAHLIELAFLLHLFRFRAQVASLALANLAFVAEAFWWGALEIMRSRVRTETSTAKIQQETSRWLRHAAWLALGAVALPLSASMWRARWAHESISVLDAYAWVCGLRLGVDLVLRTLFSGVYAKRRVYRPLATLLLADPIGLLVVVALWPRLGAWTFPLGLAISVAVSRGVALFYTLEAYRLLRQPPPRFSLWARATRRGSGANVGAQRGRVLLAGAASVSARLGPVLVLAVLLRSTINNEELGALAFTLHLAGPLLSGTASWSQVFYHDFKRLEDDVSTGLRRHLTRRLGWLAATVGAVLWLLTGVVAVTFFGGSVRSLDLLALLPLYLALAYLGVLQLRDFAHGDFSRMLGAGIVVFGALALLLFGGVSSVAAFGLPIGGAIALGIAVLAVLGARERTPSSGPLLPSLFAWLGRLHAVRTPVRIGWGRVAGGAARYGHKTAERIAPLLAERGAVTTIRAGRRVLWFEAAPSTLRPETLAVAAAGTLAAVHTTEVAPNGAQALDRALLAGLLDSGKGNTFEPSPVALEHQFLSLFPEGLIVDVAQPRDTLSALAPSVRTAIWRDALWEAHSGRTARQRSGFEVTSYRPGGEIQLLFVAPRKQPLPVRLAWREALEAANWSAAIVRREARERLTALG